MRKSDFQIARRNYMRKIFHIPLVVLTLFLSMAAANAQSGSTVKVAVTIPDFIPIVETLGRGSIEIIPVLPAGVDPVTYTLPEDFSIPEDTIDLVIFANSGFYGFEGEITAMISDLDTVDWDDYTRHGAVLEIFPYYENNMHGFWLSHENARAIAAAIAEALMLRGLNVEKVTERLTVFTEELDAVTKSGIDLITTLDRQRSTWAVMTPDLAYIIHNMDLGVGDVARRENGVLVTGQDRQEIINNLYDGTYAGILTPVSMKGSELDQLAQQIATEARAPLCYVHYLDGAVGGSYIAQASFNAGAVSAAAARGDKNNPGGGTEISSATTIFYWIIIFGLLIYTVMLNSKMQRMPVMPAKQPPASKKKKK